MQPEKTPLTYVWDMLSAAREVQEMVAGHTLESYERTRMLQLAVERAIEIIGEAARRVPEEFRVQHPEVPWTIIVATRHILAHEYDDVMPDKVWRMATIHIPALINVLIPITEKNQPPKTP